MPHLFVQWAPDGVEYFSRAITTHVVGIMPDGDLLFLKRGLMPVDAIMLATCTKQGEHWILLDPSRSRAKCSISGSRVKALFLGSRSFDALGKWERILYAERHGTILRVPMRRLARIELNVSGRSRASIVFTHIDTTGHHTWWSRMFSVPIRLPVSHFRASLDATLRQVGRPLAYDHLLID